MGNHYHLVIETPDGNLFKGMRQLNGVYTQAFNRRHHRVGHLFQGRFKGILVQKESHYLEVCRYVGLNAVRAKAVKQPREWAWSGYRATGGLAAVPRCLKVEEILSHFGQRRGPDQEKYREYVGEGIAGATIWENLAAQSLSGIRRIRRRTARACYGQGDGAGDTEGAKTYRASKLKEVVWWGRERKSDTASSDFERGKRARGQGGWRSICVGFWGNTISRISGRSWG
jgi:hypothetical protein